MSSIWNSATAPTGNSPFATTVVAPKPGGGAAARFQSLLSSSGSSGQAQKPATQLGLSPAATAPSNAKTTATAADSSSSSSDSSASITANDFLTLLVTEMQNQDPTAQTDPNAYVDQLVQINSLEQLISMNQNLALVLGTASSPAPTGSSAGSGANAVGAVSPASSTASIPRAVTPQAAIPRPTARENISAASHSVARALDGHIPAARRGHAIRDIPTH